MKRTASALLILVLLLALTGCFRVYDGPPKEDGTPEPPPHDGVFVSEYGTMTFNGDGKTVKLSIDSRLAELTGLPEGESEGTYIFFANLSPTRTDYRYDRADELEITVDGRPVSLRLYLSQITEDTIKAYVYDGDDRVDVTFVKE